MTQQWKPIASAPKDGTPVLLFARLASAEASTRVVGAYRTSGWFAQSYSHQNDAQLVPSHWMELPPFPGTPPASAQDDAKDERQAQPIKLVHLAVAEDGGVRFMTGRKLPDGIESCELYAMPDYGRAPAELFRAPAAGDARMPVLNIEAAAKAMAECMDYPWAHMPEQGRATMREHAQTVIRAASQQQEG